MAEGSARATGDPGVALVTSAAGIRNMVTAMQDALSDGTPTVVFCGQAPTTMIGTDEFQATDVLGVTKSCTKWNVRVNSIGELSQRIDEAFKIARSGRPGPVLVEVPKRITSAVLTHAPSKVSGGGLSRRLNAATLNISMASNFSLRKILDRVAHLVNIAKNLFYTSAKGCRPIRMEQRS